MIRSLFQCNINPATVSKHCNDQKFVSAQHQPCHTKPCDPFKTKWPHAAWRNCSGQVAFIENLIAPLLLIATSAAHVATLKKKDADMTGARIVCCFFSLISKVSRCSFLTWRLSTVSDYLARENHVLLSIVKCDSPSVVSSNSKNLSVNKM